VKLFRRTASKHPAVEPLLAKREPFGLTYANDRYGQRMHGAIGVGGLPKQLSDKCPNSVPSVASISCVLLPKAQRGLSAQE